MDSLRYKYRKSREPPRGLLSRWGVQPLSPGDPRAGSPDSIQGDLDSSGGAARRTVRASCWNGSERGSDRTRSLRNGRRARPDRERGPDRTVYRVRRRPSIHGAGLATGASSLRLTHPTAWYRRSGRMATCVSTWFSRAQPPTSGVSPTSITAHRAASCSSPRPRRRHVAPPRTRPGSPGDGAPTARLSPAALPGSPQGRLHGPSLASTRHPSPPRKSFLSMSPRPNWRAASPRSRTQRSADRPGGPHDRGSRLTVIAEERGDRGEGVLRLDPGLRRPKMKGPGGTLLPVDSLAMASDSE